MGISRPRPLWWDREVDEETGLRLRADVRQAAHRIWPSIQAKTEKLLGSSDDAASILEASIRAVSKYLDKLCTAESESAQDSLLALACHRALQRGLRKQRRIELVGTTNELVDLLRAPDWQQGADADLLLEQFTLYLDDDARGMLKLRMAGYGWKEIGKILKLTPETARQSFWRNLRKAHLKILRDGGFAKKEHE